MRYDISKPSAPKMPKLGKGTECIKILLPQVSNDVHEPLFLIFSLCLWHSMCFGKIILSILFGRNSVVKWAT